MFSEKVKEALIEAGSFPNRKIDITQYESTLIREGYYMPQELKDFLSEFGGLCLKCPHFEDFTPRILKRYPMLRRKKSYQVMNLNVVEVFNPPSLIPITKEEIFEPRIGEDLIEFGEIWDGRYWLAMTPSGKVYARDVDSILFLGNNYEEMLENEFHHVRPIEIP